MWRHPGVVFAQNVAVNAAIKNRSVNDFYIFDVFEMILLSESFGRAEVSCILLVDFQMNVDEYSEFWQVSLMAHGSGDGTCRASTCLQGKLGWRGEREILENMRGFSHGFLQQELCELLQGELWELYTSLGKGEGFLCKRLFGWTITKKFQQKVVISMTVKQWNSDNKMGLSKK